MSRTGLKIAGALLAVAALVALGRSLVIVDQTEAVFVTEFGRPVRLIDEPGLHWKLPYQSRRGFDKRLQLDAPPPREMLTKDKKNLEVAWYVELEDRRRRAVPAVGPDHARRLGAARGHGGFGPGGRAGRARPGRPGEGRSRLGARRPDEGSHRADRRAGGP